MELYWAQHYYLCSLIRWIKSFLTEWKTRTSITTNLCKFICIIQGGKGALQLPPLFSALTVY